MRKRMEREGFLGVLEPEDLLSDPAQKATCAAAGLATLRNHVLWLPDFFHNESEALRTPTSTSTSHNKHNGSPRSRPRTSPRSPPL